MAKKLVVVRNESATVFARFVAFVIALATLSVQIGIITQERYEAILGIIQDPKTAALISAIGTILVTCLPSIVGWATREKELPTDVTIKDVVVKPDVPAASHKQHKLSRAAAKLSLLIFACAIFSVLAST